jgi:hypothetical protein
MDKPMTEKKNSIESQWPYQVEVKGDWGDITTVISKDLGLKHGVDCYVTSCYKHSDPVLSFMVFFREPNDAMLFKLKVP